MAQARLSDEERELFRTALRRLLDNRWGVPRVGAGDCTPAEGAALLQELSALGAHALGHPDGGGIAELFVAMEELGRASCPASLLACAILEHATGPAEWTSTARDAAVSAACVFTSEGSITQRDGRLSGHVAAAEILPGTSRIVLVQQGGDVFLIPLDAPGMQVQPQSAFGRLPVYALRLESVQPECHALLSPDAATRVLSLARGAACASALGAARRAFELVTAYAKERRQFGRAIGAFQAVQHRLADCFIAIEGMSELLAYGGRLHDEGGEEWPFFVDCAFAHAADTLPACMLGIQHTFGAIGYAEEHEAPRHFRRVHWDMLAVGGRDSARAAIHRRIAQVRGMPDRPLEPDADAFRHEVRAWLADHWSADDKAAQAGRPFHLRDRDRAFGREVGARGWAALTWPVSFGGQGRPVTHQLVLAEEMERAGTPRFGAPIHAAAIMAFGTAEQQAEHLDRIRAGDGIYGIAYSEPDAGSDLASVRTSARQVGANWVINGQKIWTTTYWGDHMWVLARTDPSASPPHAGLSLFLLRTDTPGVTIVPADTMYGGKFANIFFDDVQLPPDALLGERNDAWRILNLALAVERAVIGGGILGRVLDSFDDFVRSALDAPGTASSAPIAAIAARIAVGQALATRSARAVDAGSSGLVEAAACKVFCSELMEHLFEVAVRWGGPAWALTEGSPHAPHGGRFEQRLRHSLMHVISGGTNDIQRNVIAQRGLGLPRK